MRSSGLTTQIAVHKTTRNPTITNAPAVTEDVVTQPVGIAPQGTQPIIPTPPAELAIAPSLGPSASSTPARAVTGIMRSLVVSQAGLPMLPGPIATDFQRLQGPEPFQPHSLCFLCGGKGAEKVWNTSFNL